MIVLLNVLRRSCSAELLYVVWSNVSLFLCFLREDAVPVFAKRSKTEPDPDPDPDPFLDRLDEVEVRDDLDFDVDPDFTEARDKDAVLTVEDENAADEATLTAQFDE